MLEGRKGSFHKRKINVRQSSVACLTIPTSILDRAGDCDKHHYTQAKQQSTFEDPIVSLEKDASKQILQSPVGGTTI